MKHIKRLSALFLVIALVFSLCGCAPLDELRSEQGFKNEDGSISLNGKTYLPVDYERMQDFRYMGESTRCYITDSDVPVLLAKAFGDMSYLYGDVLSMEGSYYAEESRYDFYNSEHVLDRLCTTAYLPSDSDPEIYEEKVLFIDDAVKSALESTAASSEAKELYTVTDIYLCDADGLFLHHCFTLYRDSFGNFYRDDSLTGSYLRYGDDAASVLRNFAEYLGRYETAYEKPVEIA